MEAKGHRHNTLTDFHSASALPEKVKNLPTRKSLTDFCFVYLAMPREARGFFF
jgi:hypothetical protein